MDSKSSGGISLDFSNRAQKLRTRTQQKKQEERQQEVLATTNGLSRKAFWEQRVRSRADAELYYRLYHPEYAPELCKALATHIDQLIYKNNVRGERLTDTELKLVKQAEEEEEKRTWDPLEDLEIERVKGLTQLASKRLENLLLEEEEVKKTTK